MTKLAEHNECKKWTTIVFGEEPKTDVLHFYDSNNKKNIWTVKRLQEGETAIVISPEGVVFGPPKEFVEDDEILLTFPADGGRDETLIMGTEGTCSRLLLPIYFRPQSIDEIKEISPYEMRNYSLKLLDLI